jgi:hypothetical protein
MKRFSLLFGLLLAACAPVETDPTLGDDETFFPVASSFKGFRTWESFEIPPGADLTIHVAGVRTTYINHVPDAGRTTFPVGTIIVKESEVGAIPDRQVFGRVKRGGGYNVEGANGWEWFELKNLNEQQSTIIWRGVGPPVGEMYAGDPNGGCNGCHGVASSNDFVLSEPLTLKNF